MNRFIFLFLALFMASCSQPNIDKSINRLNLNLGAEPTYLNPILSTDSPSSMVNGFIFNGLMKTNESLEMIPDLAKSYHVSQNGKLYTFKLKPNIYWHDGKELTSEDVKFTFELILNPKTNTVRRSNYIINGKKVKFKIIDKYTIQAILPQPFAPFLVHMGMGILPKHILKSTNINTTTFNRKPIGTGPFKFHSWKAGQYVKLVKNPNYFIPGPKLDEVLLKVIPDERTALIALNKGEIDQSSIPNKDYKKYKKNQRITTYKYDDLLYTYLAFNLSHPFFKDVKVRHAIKLAINKKAIVNGVLKSFGRPAYLPTAPILWSYPTHFNIETHQYNPKKSHQLLKDAGFQLNPKTKILEKNGIPFEFTIMTNKGNKDREKTAQIIQRFLKEIGIVVHLQLMEWSSFIKVINEPIHPKKFDAVILGWSLGLDPDGYSIWHSSQYPKGFNFIGYKNLIVDDLLQKGRLAIKKQQRKIMKKKIQHQTLL